LRSVLGRSEIALSGASRRIKGNALRNPSATTQTEFRSLAELLPAVERCQGRSRHNVEIAARAGHSARCDCVEELRARKLLVLRSASPLYPDLWERLARARSRKQCSLRPWRKRCSRLALRALSLSGFAKESAQHFDRQRENRRRLFSAAISVTVCR
jgi:hypothetical protein